MDGKIFNILIGGTTLYDNSKALIDLVKDQIAVVNTQTDGIHTSGDLKYFTVASHNGDRVNTARASNGGSIEANYVKHFTYSAPLDAKDKILKLDNFKIVGDKLDYSFTLSLSNKQIMAYNGFNSYNNMFNVSIDKGVTNINVLIYEVYKAIKKSIDNNQISYLKSVKIFQEDGTTEITTDANIKTFVSTNTNNSKLMVLHVETSPIAKTPTSDINLRYFKDRQTDIKFTGSLFFDVTVEQELVYPKGDGYDIRQLEYLAGGFGDNPGSMKVNAITGTNKSNFRYYSDVSKKYHQVFISYVSHVKSGSHTYENDMYLVIAMEEKAEIKKLVIALNNILKNQGFKAISIT